MDNNDNDFSFEPEPTPENKPAKPAPVLRNSASVFGTMQSILAIAVLVATLFTMWNPTNLFSNQILDDAINSWQASSPLEASGTDLTPTPLATGLRIGIISGHHSSDPNTYDPGAVCADGLTEEQVNYAIAQLVAQKLTSAGYIVEILDEYDSRLTQYRAVVLVSIHNDSCTYINDEATGYKVAIDEFSPYPDEAGKLLSCMVNRYGTDTGLSYHPGTITQDMTDYHAFNQINSNTTAAIIETGFLFKDRDFLTQHTDQVAQGIVDGILCYINNENVDQSTAPTSMP